MSARERLLEWLDSDDPAPDYEPKPNPEKRKFSSEKYLQMQSNGKWTVTERLTTITMTPKQSFQDVDQLLHQQPTQQVVPIPTGDYADSLTDHTTAPDISSDKDVSLEGWKKYTRLVLPHVGLMCLTLTYTMIGASIFYSIERPFESKVKQQSLRDIQEAKRSFLREMWAMATTDGGSSESDWTQFGLQRMDNLTDVMFLAFERYFLTAKEVRENNTTQIWTYSTAIFFAVTVVTTIGYGNPVPITFAGRLVCILFALFGIPLTLVTIADVGKFLSENLIWLYGNYRSFKHQLEERLEEFRERRRLNSAAAAEELERAGLNHVCKRGYRFSQESRDLEIRGLREQKKIPAMLVMAILVGYTALGGCLLSYLEQWSFFDAFYFSFVTMTTIGFGDIVPTKNGDIVLILLYILVGLAITTMCIDLVGVQYIRKIHYFGRRIQDARDDVLAIIGGKAVYISDIYAQFLQRKYNVPKESLGAVLTDAFLVDNFYYSRHLFPFIPHDIKRIRYIDETSESIPSSTSSLNTHSCLHCKYCAEIDAQQSKLRRMSTGRRMSRAAGQMFTKLPRRRQTENQLPISINKFTNNNNR